MNFRRLLTSVAVLPAFFVSARAAENFILENGALRREWSVDNGRLGTVAIANKLAGKTSALGASDEFRLRVSDGPDVGVNMRTLTAADFKVTGTERKTEGAVESVVFHLLNENLKADLRVSLAKGDFYLRKQLVLTALKPLTLERIDTEALALDGARQPYTISKITANASGQWKPGLGQPLYGDKDATFWGVEFPAANNTVTGDKLVCGHLYGRALEPGKPYTGYPSVMGVGDDAKFIKDAFFDYIDRIRVRPFRIQVQYNSWFDTGGGVNRKTFSESVAKIHEELVTKRGAKPFDAYVIDDGWQDTKASWANKVWPVNNKFDADFASSRADVAAAKSHLGLWMSPGMNFGAAKKVPDLVKDGYEMLPPWGSVAGPKYMGALEDRMAELVTQGVTFFKLDGIFGHLNQRVFELHGARYGLPEIPGLGAGEFSASDKRLNDPKYDELKTYYLVAGTEALMRNFDRLGKINPEVYILISNAAYLSPWWLQHCDCSWMINADDAAEGSTRTQQLIYRDSILHQISVTENTQFPLNAIFNHEPKKTHTEDAETFRRYLYMALSRGTGFIELYLKPAALKPHDWSVLAEGLLWARHTGADFKHSRMHGGDPGKKQAYGFTGWSSNSGYVSLNNPGKETATLKVTLDRALGLTPRSGPFMVSSPMESDTKGLKDRYAYGDAFEVTLAPGEVRILNFDMKSVDWSAIRRLQGAESTR